MILIAMGGNLPSPVGAPQDTLAAGLLELSERGIKVERRSRFYSSVAWPNPKDPPFVNAVVSVRTDFPPLVLLNVLQGVEELFGRKRGRPNIPRTLDIDILDYDGRVELGPPQLPHPRIEGRAFVLIPLRDVAPDWRHPVSRKSVSDLIAAAAPGGVTPLSPT
jgi:2-amino-4-hydroxy-6-hydroxymethyldihydropteridine diphosphokinase